MSISTYQELKDAVASWLARDDLTTQIEDFISFGELRIARKLRISTMEKALAETIAGDGTLALPSDYVELKHAYIDGSPVQKLERITAEKIYQKYSYRSARGKPVYVARETTNLIFGPFPDTQYDVKGVYYYRLPALSDSNTANWFTSNAPDLLLYAALREASVFIEDDENTMKYDRLFTITKEALEFEDNKEEFSGSVLRTWAE